MDYERYGRQIALQEIGVSGQRRLASARLSTWATALPLARALWTAAGGDVGEPSVDAQRAEPLSAPAELGVAAWSCVESARAALGAAPLPEIPAELLARLR